MHGSLVARCGSSLTAPALNRVYTQSSKRRQDRGGHLFLGRYKARLVDSGAYLLELSPYIVSNAGTSRRCAGRWRLAMEQLPRDPRAGAGAALADNQCRSRSIFAYEGAGTGALSTIRAWRIWRDAHLVWIDQAGVLGQRRICGTIARDRAPSPLRSHRRYPQPRRAGRGSRIAAKVPR